VERPSEGKIYRTQQRIRIQIQEESREGREIEKPLSYDTYCRICVQMQTHTSYGSTHTPVHMHKRKYLPVDSCRFFVCAEVATKTQYLHVWERSFHKSQCHFCALQTN